MTKNMIDKKSRLKPIGINKAIIIALSTILISICAGRQMLSYADSVDLEPQNGIPLVIVYVDESKEAIEAAEEASSDDPAKRDDYGTIAEMNSSEDHSVRCTGTIEIKVPGTYTGEYGSVSVPDGPVDLKFIRGRGNSTWDPSEGAKKPYKIKLEEKQDLFGMEADKEWALMANADDGTLLKNRIVSWLGEQMGFEYTPQMIPVDLVMIGSESGTKELGSYCLSELVSLGDNRLDIDDAKLLAFYTEVQNEGDPFFTTDSGVQIKYEDPEEANEQVEEFINGLDKLILDSATIDDDTHAAIADRMDLVSAAKYWWIQEFVCNNDAYNTSSSYLYIDPNAASGNGNTGWKLFWGPLWDFDLTLLNTGEGEEEGTRFGFNNTMMPWFDRLRVSDPEFTDLLKQQWEDLDPMLTELTREGGKLDQMKEEIRASWERDRVIWKDYYDPWEEEETDLDAEVSNAGTWIMKRQAWIGDNIDLVDVVYHTVTYTADGDIIGTETVRGGSTAMAELEAPEKAGYLFIGWQDRETGDGLAEINIEKDTTADAVYIREEDAVKPEAVYFAKKEEWVSLSDEIYLGLYMEVFPKDAVSKKVIWTSSDESVASVNKKGEAALLSEGDTTITATAYNGAAGSYVLHVYDPEKVSPELPSGFTVQPLELKVGQTEQISYSLQPEGGIFPDCIMMYEFEDTDCIEYDSSLGVVTGIKPGKAAVTLCLYTNDENVEYTKQLIITVTEADDPVTPPVSIDGAKVALSNSVYTYNGKVQKPTIETIDGRKLTEGEDYTVKWSNAKSKNAGSYTVTVTGKGKYTGTTKATYKINPKGTSLKKPKKAKKSITVKWKKQVVKMSKSRITGYQIQLATDKSFSKNKRTVTVKGYKKVSKKVTKLKGGKKYYIRIRTYKKVNGTNYYSPWSKARTVTTKK